LVRQFWRKSTAVAAHQGFGDVGTNHEECSVPVNADVSGPMRLGPRMVTFGGGGVPYWLDSPDSGPEGFGLRFAMRLLFPRRTVRE
jgi:hypothetical protein